MSHVKSTQHIMAIWDGGYASDQSIPSSLSPQPHLIVWQEKLQRYPERGDLAGAHLLPHSRSELQKDRFLGRIWHAKRERIDGAAHAPGAHREEHKHVTTSQNKKYHPPEWKVCTHHPAEGLEAGNYFRSQKPPYVLQAHFNLRCTKHDLGYKNMGWF